MTTPSSAPQAPTAVQLWPAKVLADRLRSEDPSVRMVALGMALQPKAPLSDCVAALVEAARLAAQELAAALHVLATTGQAPTLHPLTAPLPPVQQAAVISAGLAANALGSLAPAAASDAVQQVLVELLSPPSVAVGIATAHALFRLQCLPTGSHEPLCRLLQDPDPIARQVALLAVTPFAPRMAAALARCVHSLPPEKWQTETLLALSRSAGTEAASKRSVEGFLLRSVAGKPLLPTGVAVYGAMAELNPDGVALQGLVRIVAQSSTWEVTQAALAAIGNLGEKGTPAAKGLIECLVKTDDPAAEELLSQTLLKIRVKPVDLPAGRMAQRIVQGVERTVAAHCILLSLGGKEFAPIAGVIRQRFMTSTEGLRVLLSKTHLLVAGTELTQPA